MENENVKVNDQEQLVPQQEEQKPEENPVKEKKGLIGWIKGLNESVTKRHTEWCEKHPVAAKVGKVAKNVAIAGVGACAAFVAINEMAKRSESSEGVSEETVPWDGEDLDETETTEESTEEYPTEE